MVCAKCGYIDKKEKSFYGKSLCEICSKFAPEEIISFQEYVAERIDWKILDTFRRVGKVSKQKKGMSKKANKGKPMTRPPMGYNLVNEELIPNEDASRVHSLFRTFLIRKYSLNSLAKNFSLSVNGLKKVLTNRTYLGEIKFDGQIYKGNHKPIISQEVFYAVQRKLKDYLKPRKLSK